MFAISEEVGCSPASSTAGSISESVKLAGTQRFASFVIVCERLENCEEILLCRVEVAPVVPERVVGIKAAQFNQYSPSRRKHKSTDSDASCGDAGMKAA